METILQYWNTIPDGTQTAIYIATAVVTIFTTAELFKRYSAAGEKKMLRKDQVKEIMSEEISDMLLDLHTRDLLTAKEVNALHIKFAKQFGYWDLHPKKLLQEKSDPAISNGVATTKVDAKDHWSLQLGQLLKSTG